MPDIFDEVQEDLRAERARALGRRYAGLGVFAVILILGGTGGYVYWQQSRTAAANSVADRFITAARQADRAATPSGGTEAAANAAAAQSLAAIAADGPEGYRVLARLRLAALQWQLGQHAQAIASWQAVADDAGAPVLLRDLATLTSAQHQVDTGDGALLRQRLEALTGPANPWRPMAEQVIAMIDLRAGKTREAAGVLRRLTMDPMVPQGVSQMAADLIATLPADATAPPQASPAKPPSPHG